MKLIDLLVQELPNRGGWPAGAVEAMSFNHNPGMIHFFDDEGEKVIDAIKFDGYKAPYIDTITTEQYEAAIAASNPNSWNGEGLPPVGCECELFDCDNWNPVIIKFVGDKYVVTERTDLGYEVVYCVAERPERFRPIRTEAERKREDAIRCLSHSLRAHGSITNEQLQRLYDDIAAGVITGVKLED